MASARDIGARAQDPHGSQPVRAKRFLVNKRHGLLLLSVIAGLLAVGLGSPTLLTTLSTAFVDVLYFVWVGVYFVIVWPAVVSGQFWVLDVLAGRQGQMCGNKFVECRPWE